MAKRKKTATSPLNKKKSIASTDKKSVKKVVSKIDDKKVVLISDQIAKINKKFENLIADCKIALSNLKDNNLQTI